MAATLADDIGREIRLLRQKNEMTLRELARQAEVSPSYLSDIENGRRMASLETLDTIAATLGEPPERWMRLWVIDRIGRERWQRLLAAYG